MNDDALPVEERLRIGRLRGHDEKRLRIYRHTDGRWYWFFLRDVFHSDGKLWYVGSHHVGGEDDDWLPEACTFHEHLHAAGWSCSDEEMDRILAQIMGQRPEQAHPED